MTHVTCRLTAKNRDQFQNPTLGNLVWATLTFTSIGSSVAAEVTQVIVTFVANIHSQTTLQR